jgi:hypothetical protein
MNRKSMTQILQEVEVERRRVYGAPQVAMEIEGKVYNGGSGEEGGDGGSGG